MYKIQFKRFPNSLYVGEYFEWNLPVTRKAFHEVEQWNQTNLTCLRSLIKKSMIICHRLPSDLYLILAADWLRLVPVLAGYALLPGTFLLGFQSGRYQSAAGKNFHQR
jgi:hypothetical protein